MYKISLFLLIVLSSCVPSISVTLESARTAAQREMEYAQARALTVGFTRAAPALCEPERERYQVLVGQVFLGVVAYQELLGPLALRSSAPYPASRARFEALERRSEGDLYNGLFDQLESVIPLEDGVVQGYVNYSLSALEGGTLLCIWSGYSDSSGR